MPGNATHDSTDLCLSLAQARALQLAAMGLLTPPRRAAKKADVLATVRSMNVLQIDTIHIVARSPYLVLWSRLGDYPPAWLDELLTEGALLNIGRMRPAFCPLRTIRITAAKCCTWKPLAMRARRCDLRLIRSRILS